MLYVESLEYQLEQRNFDYDSFITAWGGEPVERLSADQAGLLGISYFRLGLFSEGERALRYAAANGSAESAVELTGCLMANFKFDEARSNAELQFEQAKGFLHGMAARWLGVLETLSGNVKYGAGLLKQSYRDFQGVGNKRGMQIAANMLGASLILRAEYAQAERYLKRSLELSNPDQEHAIWIDTGIKLFMLYAYTDRAREAKDTLDKMREYLHCVSPRASKYFDFQIKLCDLVYSRLLRNNVKFITKSLTLASHLKDKNSRHIEGMVWLGPLLIDSFSRMTNQHRMALELIAANVPDGIRFIPVQVIEAVIWSRMQGELRAVDSLKLTLDAAIQGGHRFDAVRCRLHLAGCLYLVGRPNEAIPILKTALKEITLIGRNFLIDDDLRSISPVLMYAKADAEVRELLREIDGKSFAPHNNPVEVKTFGLIEFSTPVKANWKLDEVNVLLILTYMAIRPDRTIDQIARAVLTEKYLESPESAYTYVRQCILRLKEHFGEDAIVMTQERRAGPGRYGLNDRFAFKTDFEQAYDALADGDLETLTKLYQGRFVAQSDCEFVQEINQEIEGAFYQSLLEQLNATQDIEGLQQLQRYARHLISVAPENFDAADLHDEISERINGPAARPPFKAAG